LPKMDARQCLQAKCTNSPHRSGIISSSLNARRNTLSTAAAASSLRQQQQQLTLQLADVLQQPHIQEADKVASAVQLVNQGVAALLASPDWLQLHQAFQLAARQRNTAARQAFEPATTSSSSSMMTGRPGGSSPWGFALRQPKQQAVQQPQQQSSSSSRTMAAPAPQRQQQQWDWAVVQQFMVLGQGSLGKLYASSSSAGSPAVVSECSNAGRRLPALSVRISCITRAAV
jgi:hypothetical protein